MHVSYTKLFNGIVLSTVWREDNATRLVWITMLALSDKDGIVEASIPGLADAARVSVEECCHALSRLSHPDPYSRTKDHAGRRIEEVDGGWEILNHEKYKIRASDEEKRAKAAERQRRKRARDACVTGVTVTPESRMSLHTDTDTDNKRDKSLLDTRAPKRTRPKRWRRVPKTWEPTEAHRKQAAENGVDLQSELAKFRDHEFATPKSDANAAFRNWLRRAAELVRPGKAPGFAQHEENRRLEANAKAMRREFIRDARRPEPPPLPPAERMAMAETALARLKAP